MGYCKDFDLSQEYPNLNRFNMSPDDIEAFINKADAIINANLAGAYVVPFTAVPSTPPIIREIAKDLTLSFIFTRHYTQEKRNKSDWVTGRKKEAMKLLERLTDPDDPFTIVTSGGEVIEGRTDQEQILNPMSDFAPTFTMQDPVDIEIDSDRIDAEIAERT